MMSYELVSILLPAFAAGLIVLSTHVILGRQVLQRGIVFIDLAIAQVASLGVVVSHILMAETSTTTVHQVLPVAFSLVISLLVARLAKKNTYELEAMIGCIYVIAAAMVLLVLSHSPYGTEQIERSLNGRIYWLSGIDLVIPTGVSLLFLLLLFFMPRILQGWIFYPLFAVMVTISVDLVGVYLVFSTLIMPSLGTAHIKGKKGLSLACVLGALGYLSGILASIRMDWPGGASVVVCLAIVCLIFRLLHQKWQMTVPPENARYSDRAKQ